MDVPLSLHNLQRQSRARMPGDMAMQQPGARIVGFEGDNEVAACRQKGDVSAGWIVEVQVGETGPVGCFGLFEDGEVVAVEVDLGRGG